MPTVHYEPPIRAIWDSEDFLEEVENYRTEGNAVRGIVNGLIIVAPFWAVVLWWWFA